MNKTIWELIQEKLEENHIKAYPPGAHKGECKENYVVIKQSGSMQIMDFSSEYVYYDFMIYVPLNKYNELDRFEKQVKKVIDENLYPLLVPTGSNTTDFLDDEKKAHMRSFMYRNAKRNRHLQPH